MSRRTSALAAATAIAILLVGLLPIWQSLAAATTFDAHFEKGASAQTSPFSYVSNAGTVTGTVAGSERVLIGCLTSTNSVATMAATTMTWNSVSMTAIGSFDATGGIGMSIFLFGLIAPATGNQTLAATWGGGAADVSLGAVSYTGVDQTTAWSDFTTNSGTSTSATVVVNTAASDMIFACRADSNATTATIATGTLDWDERTLNGNYGAGRNTAVGATTTVTWTLGSSVYWATAGARVRQSMGALPPSGGRQVLVGVGP